MADRTTPRFDLATTQVIPRSDLGWTTEYRPNGVVMRYLVCRWCMARSAAVMKRCSLCKGAGFEKCERVV